MADTTKAPPFLRLPPELIQSILSLLEPSHLARLAQSCKVLNTQSADDRLWQPHVNNNLVEPITSPQPLASYRDLYAAHHPYWFLPRHRIWFADTMPAGKLIIARYDLATGSIVAHTVVAQRGTHITLRRWEKDPRVVIHSFDPKVSLDTTRPVLRLTTNGVQTDDQPDHYPSDRGYGPSSKYSKEVLMEMYAEPGFYSSLMLCRALPDAAISEGTSVWPPLRFPAESRARNSTRSSFESAGHRPSSLSEVSEYTFRLRKWVEYNGRRSSPRSLPFTSPNGLAAALGLDGRYFSASMAASGGEMSIRMPEDHTTYATLPKSCYIPTPQKPWQGIFVGDYSGHGCEFIVVRQPDRHEERPLPEELSWLAGYFRGDENFHGGGSTNGHSEGFGDDSDNEDDEDDDDLEERLQHAMGLNGQLNSKDQEAKDQNVPQRNGLQIDAKVKAEQQARPDMKDVPTGRLEAIKLTGDINIPRGEYTFIAPDIGHGGFIRIADEELFRGARVVRSAGHIAHRGFVEDGYIPSQLIMVSHDTLAQYWEDFGHISYYRRVDLEALADYTG